ncbi:MAG: M17 family peptidase N-terminal domain-containing protein [bacterium]|nr:M17 family peptidase N-terminal domain-containing protein [bacterium]
MRLILARRPFTDLQTPLLVLSLFSDRLPTRGHTAWCDWRLDGAIASLVLDGILTGQLGQKHLIGGADRVGAERVLLFGFGPASAMNPKKLQKAVALAAADVAKLKLGGWSLGVMGRELEAISYQDAAASTLRGLLQSSGRDEAVRIVEEEPESFALLVREAPIWLQAMAGKYGRECDLVLEDEG